MYGAALVGRISRAAIFHNTDPALCDANYSNPNRSSESICDHFKQVGSGPSSAPYSLTVDFGFLLSFAVVCLLSLVVSKVFRSFTSKKDDHCPLKPSVHVNIRTQGSTDAIKPTLSDSNINGIESDNVNEVQGTSADLTDNSPPLEKTINNGGKEDVPIEKVKDDLNQTADSEVSDNGPPQERTINNGEKEDVPNVEVKEDRDNDPPQEKTCENKETHIDEVKEIVDPVAENEKGVISVDQNPSSKETTSGRSTSEGLNSATPSRTHPYDLRSRKKAESDFK